MEKCKRGSVLEEAIKVINGERLDVYGLPENSFKIIGEYWTTYLKAEKILPQDAKPISPIQATEMLMLFKMARLSGQKKTRDTYVDIAGYTGIAGDMLK